MPNAVDEALDAPLVLGVFIELPDDAVDEFVEARVENGADTERDDGLRLPNLALHQSPLAAAPPPLRATSINDSMSDVVCLMSSMDLASLAW